MFIDSLEAIQAIESKRNNHSDLNKFKEIMNELNNPQDSIKSIHIAGTNGKGSTTDFIRSILQSAGYKVGTFTSPYLISHHDRIRINNVNIDDQRLLDYINQTKVYWDTYDLNMFDIDMMIASLYFKDENVDFAIFEVGMGGRIDATNVLNHPLMSVITNIGKDHMQFLGDTLEKIAYEKAGIIKENVDCVTASDSKECVQVFNEVCESKHSKLITIDSIENIKNENGISFDYKNTRYHLKSNASYQCKNASLAIEVIHQLNHKKIINLSDEQLINGLCNTEWAGRFEVMRKDPLIIIDGAHNEHGINALVDSLKGYENIKIIFSCLADKNGKEMLSKLMEISSDITVCDFDFYRADSSKRLAEGFDVKTEKDYQKAIIEALDHKGTLVISGSLYFVSIVRKFLKDILKD